MNSPIVGRLPRSHYCCPPGTLETSFPYHSEGAVWVLIKAHPDLGVFLPPKAVGSPQSPHNTGNLHIQLGMAGGASRQICWQTTALSKAVVGWEPTCSFPYGQAAHKNSVSERLPRIVTSL